MHHLKKTPGASLSVMAREDGSLTSDRTEILQQFAGTWQKIYTRLKDSPPSFEDFNSQFGQFISNEPTGETSAQLLSSCTSKLPVLERPRLQGWTAGGQQN